LCLCKNCGIFYCELWAVQNFACYDSLAIFLAHFRKKSRTISLALFLTCYHLLSLLLRGPAVITSSQQLPSVLGQRKCNATTHNGHLFHCQVSNSIGAYYTHELQFLAQDVIYISRAYAMMPVSVCL